MWHNTFSSSSSSSSLLLLLLFSSILFSSAERRRIRKKMSSQFWPETSSKAPQYSTSEYSTTEFSTAKYSRGNSSSQGRRPGDGFSDYRFLNPFSLFNIVQFPNTACPAVSGMDGVCYTGTQCTKKGGKADGTCASGFGTCCTFSAVCDSETSQNGTFFSSPSTIPTVCSLMVSTASDKICQVRLNFIELELLDPDSTGRCMTDYIQITGGVSQSSLPSLCGTLTGQHLIYSAIPNFPARLSIVTGTTATAALTRKWKIQILQYECDSPSIAPEGCLQYYTGITGNVSSFNWKLMDNRLDTEDPKTLGNHLSNLDYSICIRRERGYCGIEWSTPTPAEEQVGYFSVSETLADSASPITLSDADIKLGDTDCTSDYILIPAGTGGTDPASLPKDRFCGQALGYCSDADCTLVVGPVKSMVTPFTIGVFTDSEEADTDELNRGFFLNYRQHPCLG